MTGASTGCSGRCSRTRWISPTCTSSSRTRSPGRSRTAWSRTAAPASSRGSACGRSPARRPDSPTRTRSCCRRWRRPRVRRARSRCMAASGASARGGRKPGIGCICRRTPRPRSPPRTRSPGSNVSIARRGASIRASCTSPPAWSPCTKWCSSPPATGSWPRTCVRWCVSTSRCWWNRAAGANRATPAPAAAIRSPSSSQASGRSPWRVKPCARRSSISRRGRHLPAP